jgi:glucose-6-phosphate isomerase
MSYRDPRTRCDRTGAWAALRQHYERAGRGFDLRQAFAGDAQRAQRLSQQAPHVYADLSKNLTDAPTEALLMALARETGLEAYRDAMFAGERINVSENRAALHTLLRQPPGARVDARLTETFAQVQSAREAMLAFAEQVRADGAITDVVNIGIGGSDLGPRMAVQALGAHAAPGKRFHFVSNIDGHELAAVLRPLAPERTLFLITSKTFTTAETMTNARSARRWFEQAGGRDVARHFTALTANADAARAFGITTVFTLWDWVGGRYSLWSAIGLPVAIAIGAQGFGRLLAGAHAMDEHFRSTPLERNLPARLGLLDVWYRDFHRFASRSVAPYHSALDRLPAYLQQLEMESNGKQRDAHGQPVAAGTAPVLWGESGTNGQHAYFQMLHQGTDVIPLEFIAVRQPAHDLPEHHPRLLANALAQARALMAGHADPSGHKHLPGNRPSTFFVLEQLTPESLGALLALYEHRVFTSGAVWGINSFDQWGVELGKALAQDIEPRLGSGNTEGLDASTAALLEKLRGYPRE